MPIRLKLEPLYDARSTEAPVFVFHDITGNCWWAMNLMPKILSKFEDRRAPRSIYAVEAIEPENPSIPCTLDELLEKYLSLIRKQQPHGPYSFIGYSFGGVLAHQLAKKLEELGEPIAYVGVIDSIEPELINSNPLYFAHEITRLVVHLPYPWDIKDFPVDANFSNPSTQEALINHLRVFTPREQLNKIRLSSSPALNASWALMKFFLYALADVKITILKGAILTLFAADETMLRVKTNYGLNDLYYLLGWNLKYKYVAIPCKTLPGDHFSILKEGPALEQLSECVAYTMKVTIPDFCRSLAGPSTGSAEEDVSRLATRVATLERAVSAQQDLILRLVGLIPNISSLLDAITTGDINPEYAVELLEANKRRGADPDSPVSLTLMGLWRTERPDLKKLMARSKAAGSDSAAAAAGAGAETEAVVHAPAARTS